MSRGHEEEEEHRRFAREIVTWLSEQRFDPGACRVTVFAPARLLGLLRREVREDGVMDLREGELAHLRLNELSVHPAVKGVVAGA